VADGVESVFVFRADDLMFFTDAQAEVGAPAFTRLIAAPSAITISPVLPIGTLSLGGERVAKISALDWPRLEFAAACLDSVAWEFKRLAELNQKFQGFPEYMWDELTDEDAARFGTAAETIAFLAEEIRRSVIKMRGTDEAAGTGVPNDPAAFEASISRPPPPPFPEPPACVGSPRLDEVRATLADALSTLSRGTSLTVGAAIEQMVRLLAWCRG
jgi:hypothetical protein